MTITTLTATEIQTAIDNLTPLGKKFMQLVGEQHFDHFDEGIVEGEGNWGHHMAWQAAEALGKGRPSMGGVMRTVAHQPEPLWHITYDQGQEEDGPWWSLTALGAAVAVALATPEPTPEPEPVKPAPNHKSWWRVALDAHPLPEGGKFDRAEVSSVFVAGRFETAIIWIAGKGKSEVREYTDIGCYATEERVREAHAHTLRQVRGGDCQPPSEMQPWEAAESNA